MADDKAIIELRGVEKYYDSGEGRIHVLSSLDMRVERGEMIVVKGPSGSGKTTLLNLIGGLDQPNAGTVTVDGWALERQEQSDLTRFRAQDVGFIFQFHNLIPTLTVEENVLTGIEAKRPITPRDRETVHAYLERIGLREHRTKFPTRLSGGQQQRVAIARALVKAPRIILADEPTGSLDEANGRMVIELIRCVQREIDATVVLVTHNSEITRSADRVVRLRSGRILEGVDASP
jgi:putative ABC transport system ATP-binding protein